MNVVGLGSRLGEKELKSIGAPVSNRARVWGQRIVQHELTTSHRNIGFEIRELREIWEGLYIHTFSHSIALTCYHVAHLHPLPPSSLK